MKQFENKVLLIENKEMHNEVYVLIQKSGKKVDACFKHMFCGGDNYDFLYHDHNYDETEFSLGPKRANDLEITLEEFKELLKQT